MHEDEFVRENEEILRSAATSPEQVRQVEDLIEAAQAVAEHRLLTEIWWPTPEQAMRSTSSEEASGHWAAEALDQFERWQEEARRLTSARQVLQEKIQMVPPLLWPPKSLRTK